MPSVRIVFHRLAAQDYLVALRWYARRSTWASQGFRAAVDQVLQRIASAPLHGTLYRGRFHWIGTKRYPYIIYYEIIDPALVRILAVAHSRRRPGYWLRRARP
jgi:toxin ParE1/3/4